MSESKKVAFEIFDCTNDPRNFSVGLFDSLKEAIEAAIEHPPTGIGKDVSRFYAIELRAFGFNAKLSARQYTVHWKEVADESGNMYFVANTNFKIEPQPEARPVVSQKMEGCS